MQETFEQLLKRLSQDQTLFQSVEEATRQGVILPILAQLDWNTYNIREVVPEFSVGNGRIDYCLKVGDKKVVFLEVKRITEDLERHEKQILEYSFHDGVEIAILTNGLLWWLYLPLSKGTWQQRKFFTIDIKQQDPESAARHFKDFLSRARIADGTALNHAQSLQASRERTQLIEETIPRAWDQLLREPDERLLELLANKVESMCGHRPDPQLLAEHVVDAYPLPAPKPSKPPATLSHKSLRVSDREPVTASITQRTDANRMSRQRGITVKVGKREFDADSVPDLYTQVLKYLCNGKHIEKIKPYLPYATSNQRYLLAREPYHQGGNAFRVPVEYNGYFMEAHKSYDTALNALEGLLKLCDLSMEQTR